MFLKMFTGMFIAFFRLFYVFTCVCFFSCLLECCLRFLLWGGAFFLLCYYVYLLLNVFFVFDF